ncbi:hypothetical protein A2U01_0083711, partial [Trifolium medium]|nr:hypothetical protein [Trifolium medium]
MKEGFETRISDLTVMLQESQSLASNISEKRLK